MLSSLMFSHNGRLELLLAKILIKAHFLTWQFPYKCIKGYNILGC